MSSHGLVPAKKHRIALQKSIIEIATSFTNRHVVNDLESQNDEHNDKNWLQEKYDKDKHPLQLMVRI